MLVNIKINILRCTVIKKKKSFKYSVVIKFVAVQYAAFE